jgi:hypothetical protein
MEKAAKDLDFMQAAKLRDDIKKITRTVDLITLFSKIFNNKSAGIITLGAFSIFFRTRLVASGFRPIRIAVCLMASASYAEYHHDASVMPAYKTVESFEIHSIGSFGNS